MQGTSLEGVMSQPPLIRFSALGILLGLGLGCASSGIISHGYAPSDYVQSGFTVRAEAGAPAALMGADLLSVQARRNKYDHCMLLLKLTPSGKQRFAELTQARSVGMQTVEVLLGERVIAQPRVMQAISGGQFEVVWNLTPCEQAMDSFVKGGPPKKPAVSWQKAHQTEAKPVPPAAASKALDTKAKPSPPAANSQAAPINSARLVSLIREEFDLAPRDPVGEHTSLYDLDIILRQVDRCDPAVGGYKLSKKTLRIMRNTPFAKRGQKFASADLAQVFMAESWYRPDPSLKVGEPPELDRQDRSCVAKIKALEDAL
jgi:hypothetical protein